MTQPICYRIRIVCSVHLINVSHNETGNLLENKQSFLFIWLLDPAELHIKEGHLWMTPTVYETTCVRAFWNLGSVTGSNIITISGKITQMSTVFISENKVITSWLNQLNRPHVGRVPHQHSVRATKFNWAKWWVHRKKCSAYDSPRAQGMWHVMKQ